ncbi:MAG: UvrD-helicase domain-containing protein, partial [Pyrinomonadaceae bacterium]|nr:UvrD-helicase domain-containing protein [Pyrinomonadaceae bacterium]
LATFDACVAELDRIEDTYDLPDPDVDAGIRQMPTIRRFLLQIEEVRDHRPSLERALAWAPQLKGGGAQKNWDVKQGCRDFKAVVKELNEANALIAADLRTGALADVMPMAGEFVSAFAAKRRRDGRLTFDDLLLWARDVLATHPDVLADFRDHFSAILVDEFQDTDPVQAELVLLLAGAAGTDAVAAGKLTVVGDPKQSIYRFRHADIAIYDEVKRGPLRDDLLQIRQNFRSVDGIIRWANLVFDRLLEEAPGRQPGNVPLEPSGFSTDGDQPAVVVVHGDDPDAKGKTARTEEARLLAATFAKIHAERWRVRDQLTGESRDTQWRDMALLVPWRTDIDIFEDAFAAAGVPLRHEGGKTFFRRQEVRELANLLHAVDDPGDRVALVATLRSPMFGCSDDDLLLWVAAKGSWNYLGGWQDVGGPDIVRDGLAMLRELHRARAGLSLPELVRRVLEVTGVVEHALTREDGRATAANLLKLVDQARDFSASGGGGLRAFTRWLARNSEDDSEETDAGVSEETDDIVRVLTIHAAKGLEFPIVALANLSSQGRNTVGPIADVEAHRLHVRVGTAAKTGWFTTPGYDEATADEKELIALERIRLLYVAVTRARDHLIVPFVGKSQHMLQLLEGSLPGPGEPKRAEALGVHILDRDTLELADAEIVVAPLAPVADEQLHAAATELEAWQTAHDDIVSSASAGLTIETATSLEKPWRPLVVSSETPDATLILGEGPPLPIGDAVHRVMELITFPDATDLEALARAVCAEAEIDDAVDEVIKLARRCLESKVMQQAIVSDQLLREVAFTIPAPDGTGFVNGRIDVLFRDDEEWT